MGIKKMVLHPGSAVNTTIDQGLENIINGLSFFSENKKQTLSNKHNLLINH